MPRNRKKKQHKKRKQPPIIDQNENKQANEPSPDDDVKMAMDNDIVGDDDKLAQIADDNVTNQKTEITQLQNTNLELQNEIAVLKQQLLKRDKLRNQRCYIRNEVLEYNSINKEKVVMRPQIKQNQKTFEDTFSIHVDRLIKWNAFSDDLQNQFENNNNNDDEEKNEQNEVTKLLNSYINCMRLLVEQQSRAENIGEYAVSLSKYKKELKNIVKEYNMNHEPAQQKYEQLCAIYTNLKLKREELQGQVVKLITNINQITDEENKVNQEKCEILDSLNICVVEREKYDALLKNCKQLTSKYVKFETNVDNKMDEINAYFASKWDDHQRLWAKWDVNDIMCWIGYLIHDNKIKLSNDVDLDGIKEEMNTQKITGKSLAEMEKTDLKLFGFTVFDDITQIYKRIRELVSKYPDVNDDDIEGKIQVTIQIPQEYICPISGKIMVDPVIYDGITFDRNNLLVYVKQNGTIPGTDEQYDKDEGLFKNRKLKQKIDAFLSVNPQFVNEGL